MSVDNNPWKHCASLFVPSEQITSSLFYVGRCASLKAGRLGEQGSKAPTARVQSRGQRVILECRGSEPPCLSCTRRVSLAMHHSGVGENMPGNKIWVGDGESLTVEE
jgi:hypothetical protein